MSTTKEWSLTHFPSKVCQWELNMFQGKCSSIMSLDFITQTVKKMEEQQSTDVAMVQLTFIFE